MPPEPGTGWRGGAEPPYVTSIGYQNDGYTDKRYDARMPNVFALPTMVTGFLVIKPLKRFNWRCGEGESFFVAFTESEMASARLRRLRCSSLYTQAWRQGRWGRFFSTKVCGDGVLITRERGPKVAAPRARGRSAMKRFVRKTDFSPLW